LAAALRSEAATNARRLGENELVPSGNLDIDLRGALRKPNSTLDPILKDGDVINVPETPTTVTVTGAVVLPSAILYKPGAGLDYYLPRAGGLTNDSSIQEILIIRATGGIIRYKKGVKIELGDNILIPTRVQAVRLKDNVNALQTITQTVTSAGISLALIRSLTR
jgi:protein involved in polysaccharide export with SLBB domain